MGFNWMRKNDWQLWIRSFQSWLDIEHIIMLCSKRKQYLQYTLAASALPAAQYIYNLLATIIVFGMPLSEFTPASRVIIKKSLKPFPRKRPSLSNAVS